MKTLLILLFIVVCYFPDVCAQVLVEPPPPPAPASPLFNEKDQSFAYVEKMPEFKGGQAEMYKFMTTNIYVPDTCREQGISGQVVVQFMVDSMGYVRNSKVVRNTSIDCGYDEVSLQMLEKMNQPEPHWIPGRHSGKNVNVTFTLPVRFKLTD